MSAPGRKSARPTRATGRQRKPAHESAITQPPAGSTGVEAPAESTPPACLKLEGSCTIRDSIDMQFQLLAVDFGDSDVLVDGSVVERVDTAGLQMLVSFAKHQANRGKPMRWTAVSPELARGSRLLGLAAMLGLPETDGGSEVRGD